VTAARTETPPIRTDPPAAAPRMRDRAVRLAPSILPGVMMLVIGLIGADRAVLSWDEVATADVARRSAAQIWHLSHTVDGVFAPYYLAMHLWTSVVGTTVLDLRLPSIMALAGELGLRLFNPATGLVASMPPDLPG